MKELRFDGLTAIVTGAGGNPSLGRCHALCDRVGRCLGRGVRLGTCVLERGAGFDQRAQ